MEKKKNRGRVSCKPLHIKLNKIKRIKIEDRVKVLRRVAQDCLCGKWMVPLVLVLCMRVISE